MFYGLILLSLVFLLITLYIIRKRKIIYPYNVQKDYYYNFKNTRSEITTYILEDSIINLSNLCLNEKTVFLEISLKSTFLGKIFQPYIEIKSEKNLDIQYFEHNVCGKRYLNLSSFVVLGNKKIILNGKNLYIKNQNVKIISFKKKSLNNKKILILSPHPDDAEISAYGLYSHYNTNTYIVTITAGNGGAQQYSDLYTEKVQHYQKKGRIRTWNSISIPLLAGIDHNNILNLGFFDGSLKSMYEDKKVTIKSKYTKNSNIDYFRNQNISSLKSKLSGVSNWNSLVENLCILIKEIEPDIIISPYSAIDWHSDHKYSTIALLEALEILKIKKGELFLYTNHYSLTEFYPYGKQESIVSLPPSFQEIYFETIYSYNLSNIDQKDKVIALDAMNDLRPNIKWINGDIKLALKNRILNILGIELNYYKLAVRRNELFFTVQISSLFKSDISKKIINEKKD